MKIAIVSDTHDNTANFNKVIDFLNTQNITIMLHCGDICNRETMDEAIERFKGEIHFVRGNGDTDLETLPEVTELEFGKKKISFVHYPHKAKEFAQTGNYDMVFYGHTHRPWEEKVGKCRLVNPGELAGQRYKPCFAVYDTQSDKLELKILETL